MGRPKSGKTAPKGRMSLIDRYSGGLYTPPATESIAERRAQTPTGQTVSTSQQMTPVAAPAKIEEKKVAPKAVAKKAPAKKAPAKPAANAPRMRPPVRPVSQPQTGAKTTKRIPTWLVAARAAEDAAKRRGDIKSSDTVKADEKE